MVYSHSMRTNIDINESLVRKARKLTRLKTKRQIVDKALELLVRSESRKGILRYYGSGIWKGDPEPCGETGLILVDSSVWIDFLSSSPSSAGAELRRMITDAEPFALAGVIVTEILQGLKRDVSRLEHYLSQWEMLEPRGFSMYREAASIFRAARAKGVAVTTPTF